MDSKKIERDEMGFSVLAEIDAAFRRVVLGVVRRALQSVQKYGDTSAELWYSTISQRHYIVIKFTRAQNAESTATKQKLKGILQALQGVRSDGVELLDQGVYLPVDVEKITT